MELNVTHQLARAEMNKYGLSEWAFLFDNARRRFGFCSFRNKTVSLSKYLTQLNSQEHVMDCIRHEIAHALAGPKAHHGRAWKDKCAYIGCSQDRVYSDVVVQPPRPYTATCPTCGMIYERNRPRQGTHCSKCYKKVKGNMSYLSWRRV